MGTRGGGSNSVGSKQKGMGQGSEMSRDSLGDSGWDGTVSGSSDGFVNEQQGAQEGLQSLLSGVALSRALGASGTKAQPIIFYCRVFCLMGVRGSLFDSFLCFVKGCVYVWKSVQVAIFDATHRINSYKVLKLTEALDTYLVATVMLIFGMGLYELFVNELDSVGTSDSHVTCKSNLFGLFRLQERPKWLQINGLDALKEELGHVIVMILFVGMFEVSKKVPV